MEQSSFTWERFNRNSFNGRSRNRDLPQEDLFVFGYSCKLYRDSEKFAWINSGRHLIPWMGQDQLLIDRYDARGYLNDLSEYDGKLTSRQSSTLSIEEVELERLLNEERFADLNYEDETTTEAEIDDAANGQYSKVAYQYDKPEGGKSDIKVNGDKEDNKEDAFTIPLGLIIPGYLTLPESNKHHCIIEKTALFVAQQGSQMEILLKTKQAANSSFNFLSIDSPLNPYYKFLLNEIKTGKYVSKESNGQVESDSGDNSDDDNYLHPSLLSSKSHGNANKGKLNITNVFTKSKQEDDSYSQLVKHFKDKFADDIEDTSNSFLEKSPDTKSDEPPPAVNSSTSSAPVSSLIPQPPPDEEVIIAKLAQHVGKNGEDFESSIKALNDKKFEFLNPGHIYHAFYVKQKIGEIAKQKKTKGPAKSGDSSRTIAFSISSRKEPPKKISQNVLIEKALEEGVNQSSSSESSLTKEQRLQIERKKKVYEFVNLLRKEKRNDSQSIAYGPDMPKPKNDIQLSPTIEEVTSPNHSPKCSSHEAAPGGMKMKEKAPYIADLCCLSPPMMTSSRVVLYRFRPNEEMYRRTHRRVDTNLIPKTTIATTKSLPVTADEKARVHKSIDIDVDIDHGLVPDRKNATTDGRVIRGIKHLDMTDTRLTLPAPADLVLHLHTAPISSLSLSNAIRDHHTDTTGPVLEVAHSASTMLLLTHCSCYFAVQLKQYQRAINSQLANVSIYFHLLVQLLGSGRVQLKLAESRSFL